MTFLRGMSHFVPLHTTFCQCAPWVKRLFMVVYDVVHGSALTSSSLPSS